MRVCVFVDGENFRHSILRLFAEDGFRESDYLPPADWAAFFNYVASRAAEVFAIDDWRLVRTYWYVIDTVDQHPRLSDDNAVQFCVQHKEQIDAMIHDDKLPHISDDESALAFFARRRDAVNADFDGRKNVQRAIAHANRSLEFRRSGTITYDLLKNRLGPEKTVDVNMAVDILQLHNIYDICVIVSNDQDYTPAVAAAKNLGKMVCNVSFPVRDGKPSSSTRLNEITDGHFSVKYGEMKKLMNINPGPLAP